MVFDFPGVMTEFAKIEPGEFFIFFDEGRRAFAMKIFDASVEQVTSSQKKMGVLSFSLAVHPSMTPPTVLNVERFQNRDVCVLRDVVIRPPFDITDLRNGSPSEGAPGPIMIASDGVFIRASPNQGQKTIRTKFTLLSGHDLGPSGKGLKATTHYTSPRFFQMAQ